MKRITSWGAALALCLAASVAAGAVAIVIEATPVHRSAKDVIETLPLGTKVTTGKINGEWVAVRYQKPDEDAARQGWIKRTALEEIPPGYDARVSQHCILHVQDPRNVERFDLDVTEEFCSAVAQSLVNGQGEPPFDPRIKLRIYLLSGQTFQGFAKRHNQPAGTTAFSPGLGQVYVDFSLRSTTPLMKGLIVHELARLVLRAYANQPPNRPGVGAPLPTWLIEAFATCHEYLAGFNTDNLLYVDDKPRLSTIANSRGLPRHAKDRREYLATAGALGHMLLNYGGRQQFSRLVRIIQAGGGSAEALMLRFYDMSRGKFQGEWATYVDRLKQEHGIREREKEIDEGDEDEDRRRDHDVL